MITSLSLSNFKSWRHVDAMRLAPITVLFGANSSGKTSLLQWLLLLKQTIESSDRHQVLNFGDDRSRVELGTFQDIIHKHDLSTSLSWSLDWSLPEELSIEDPEKEDKWLLKGDHLSFGCNVASDDGRMTVQSMTYGFGGHEFTYAEKRTATTRRSRAYELSETGSASLQFKRTQGRAWDLPSPVKCYGFPDEVNSYYQNTGFLTDLQFSFEKLFHQTYYLGPLREYPHRQYAWGGAQPADMGERGDRVIDAILSSQLRGDKISRGKGRRRLSVEEYAAHWLKKLGLVASFSVDRVAKGSNLYQVKVKKTASSSSVLITDVGFGISQILPVIVLCYYVPEGSTVILEQPEIHLHPLVQSGLADVFLDAMRVRNIQLIIESHSEHLLKRFQRRIAEETVSKDDVAIYFCKYEGTSSHLESLNLDEFGNITNWPRDFFGDEFGEMAAMTEAAMKRKRGGAA